MCFRTNKLYLDKVLAEDIAKFLGNQILVAGEHWQTEGKTPQEQHMGAQIKSALVMQERSEILLSRIESRFQEMLGVFQTTITK